MNLPPFLRRFSPRFKWRCDAPYCRELLSAHDKEAFKFAVMKHRKVHNTSDWPAPFERVWDDSLYGESGRA